MNRLHIRSIIQTIATATVLIGSCAFPTNSSAQQRQPFIQQCIPLQKRDTVVERQRVVLEVPITTHAHDAGESLEQSIPPCDGYSSTANVLPDLPPSDAHADGPWHASLIETIGDVQSDSLHMRADKQESSEHPCKSLSESASVESVREAIRAEGAALFICQGITVAEHQPLTEKESEEKPIDFESSTQPTTEVRPCSHTNVNRHTPWCGYIHALIPPLLGSKTIMTVEDGTPPEKITEERIDVDPQTTPPARVMVEGIDIE